MPVKWDIDKAEGVMWIAGEAAKSLLGSMKDVAGTCFTEHICYIKDKLFHWCTLEEENEKIGRFLIERFKGKGFLNVFIKNSYRFYRDAIPVLNRLDKIDFSGLDNGELFKIFKKANDIYVRFWDWAFIFEPFDYVMPGMIETRLKKYGYSQKEISDMLVIADISYVNREMQELIKIAKAPQKRQKSLLEKHAYKYRWLQSGHLGRKDIPFSYFEDILNELKKKNLSEELAKLKKFRLDVLKRKKQILKKKPVDKETRNLIEMTDRLSPLHDRRKELFLRSIYTADTIRAEIAKRYGFTKDELAVFQIEDILKLQQGKKLDKECAKEMAKESLLYINTRKDIWKYYSGKKARAIFEKEVVLGSDKIKEIRGMCASPGKAKGRVRIIYGVKSMDKMKAGDILVSSMTKPEIITALKKAAAIITDEGGVTCHAAIVSRELKIPCIIGTRIASDVLKDNDLVEVDADKGVVRILK